MVRVTSLPEGVSAGTVRVTVPFALPPFSTNRLDGKEDLNPWLLVAWITKFPPVPLVDTVNGTTGEDPGSKTSSDIA